MDDDAPIAFIPPRISWAPGDEGPPFYEWQEVYPFLEPLLAARELIWEEAQAANRWHDWPVSWPASEYAPGHATA